MCVSVYRSVCELCLEVWILYLKVKAIFRKTWGGGLVGWWLAYLIVDQQVISQSPPRTGKLTTLTFPPVVHDWVIKGLGMSSRVCVTGHRKDPAPLAKKSRA